MKYDEKYPHAKLNEECETGLFIADKEYPCMMCSQPTRWVQVLWYGSLCSEECEQLLSQEAEWHGAILLPTEPGATTPSETPPS